MMMITDDPETQPLLGNIRSPLVNPSRHVNLSTDVDTTYRVYKQRWFVLGVLALINVSNGMLWVSFSPIADSTAEYYHINASQVNWLAVVFMITAIVISAFVIWFLDVVGLRAGILLSAWLNALGAVLRILSCLSSMPHGFPYILVLSGQILCAMAQPFIMFAPTKLSAQWFAADQRALANTIATVSNAVGIMIANLLSPALVKEAQDLPKMMYAYSAPAVLAVLLATFGVCHAAPPTPPTSSAAEVQEPFLLGLKKLFRLKSFWVLAVCYGTGVALFTALTTLLEQILCPQGYTDTFAGICGALMIAVGLVGAALAAVYVDRTKKFEEVAKGGLALGAICLIGFTVLARYPNMHVILAVLVSLVGFFGFASNPISLELSVECTFPIAEATTAGILVVSGQIQSMVFVMLMQALAKPYHTGEVPHQTCRTSGVTGIQLLNYNIPDMSLGALGAVVAIFFISCFKCEYKRLRAEQCLAAEEILHSGRHHRHNVLS